MAEPMSAWLALNIVAAIPAAIGSFVSEGSRRKEAPETQPYTWGLYVGFKAAILGVLLAAVSLSAFSGGIGVEGFFLLLVGVAYAVSGLHTVRRKRWAWVSVTFLSFNPVLWIINFIYGRNRWMEFAPAGRAEAIPNGPPPDRSQELSESVSSDMLTQPRARDLVASRSTFRTLSAWHPGQLALLWAAGMALVLILGWQYFALPVAQEKEERDSGVLLTELHNKYEQSRINTDSVTEDVLTNWQDPRLPRGIRDMKGREALYAAMETTRDSAVWANMVDTFPMILARQAKYRGRIQNALLGTALLVFATMLTITWRWFDGRSVSRPLA